MSTTDSSQLTINTIEDEHTRLLNIYGRFSSGAMTILAMKIDIANLEKLIEYIETDSFIINTSTNSERNALIDNLQALISLIKYDLYFSYFNRYIIPILAFILFLVLLW